ncbi:uncharacterized protein LOC132539341 [Erinaceus europaeus]|uniref:Uncharacterized protein LOC132539341 n=1 Tax=Erinaceus europaeus TaxID=9365 RepID=A0ABM3XKZ3_ERIEU|nr:uncharacterized protein LOC132539341 [Erinaceus europaeus]
MTATMKNQTVTYAELNLVKVSKKQQRKPKNSESSILVPEQEIIYADLNLHTASQALQGKDKHYLCKGLSFPLEKLLAGILGFLCVAMISTMIAVKPRNTTSDETNSSPQADTSKKKCNHCPKGWVTYSNNCYYNTHEKKTWNESVKDCASKNSSLLSIDNEEEVTFLSSISTLSWINVFREGSDQPWRSRNGSTFKLEIKGQTSGKDCAVLFSSGLKADNCVSLQIYNCKKKLNQEKMDNQIVTYAELNTAKNSEKQQLNPKGTKGLTSAPCYEITYVELCFQNASQDLKEYGKHCQCKEEWFAYSGNCYYYSSEPKPWKESVMVCASNNSNLLSIDNKEEMDFLRSIAIVSWIGVPDESSVHPWIPIDGSISKPTAGPSQHTAAEMSDQRQNHPERDLDSRGQQMKGLPFPPGKVMAEVLGIICFVLLSTIVKVTVLISYTVEAEQSNSSPKAWNQKEKYNHCPKGWVTYSNNCYYNTHEMNTWNESVKDCASKNSSLLYIDNKEEVTFLSSISVVSWIDVFREGSDQPWRSRNGSTFKLE